MLLYLRLQSTNHHINMKKVFGLLFVAGLFVFASCESGTTTTEETTTDEVIVEEEDATMMEVDTTTTEIDTTSL